MINLCTIILLVLGKPCIVIANKADKIAITKVGSAVHDLQNSLNPLQDLEFLPFSSERKIYTENTWKKIENYVDFK